MAEKWAASTFNHYRALMMLVYREARRVGKVSVNPARELRHRREDNSRVRYLADEEDRRLREIVNAKYPWHVPELDAACTQACGREANMG
jgi:hypothetical protein